MINLTRNAVPAGRQGFAQIPLMIALLLMAIAIPVATKIVQQEQDTRNMAAGNTSQCTKDADCSGPCAYCMKSGSTFKCVSGCGGVPTFKPTAGGPTAKPTAKPTDEKPACIGNGVATTKASDCCSGYAVGGRCMPKTAMTSTPVPGSGGSGDKQVDEPCLFNSDCAKGLSCVGVNPLTRKCVKVGDCSYLGATVKNGETRCFTIPGGSIVRGCDNGNLNDIRTYLGSDNCTSSGGAKLDEFCLTNSSCAAGLSCVGVNPLTRKCVKVGDCSYLGATVKNGETRCFTIPGGSIVRGCDNGNLNDIRTYLGSDNCNGTVSTPIPTKKVVDPCATACIDPSSYQCKACLGSNPSTTPKPTAISTIPPGGGGTVPNPTAVPTKPNGGGGGTCTNECPSSDGVLRSCNTAEGHSVCNQTGRIAACGGQQFCCPVAGGAWTADLTKCPVATPTVAAGTEPVLKFRMAFYGINPVAACALSKDLPLSVIVRNNDGTNKTYTGVIATKVANTTGNLAYYDVTLRLAGFKQTGKFSVFVKSPKHLQVKYGVNNQAEYYNKAGGELDGLTSDPATTPVFSFEKYPLLAGDITGPDGKQDGVVDGRDFAAVKTETVKRTEVASGGYMLSDLNGNCKMESQDLSILMISLSVKQGQLY